MTIFQLLVLPVFLAILFFVQRFGNIVLDALIVNVMCYTWIFLIWDSNQRSLVFRYLLFLLVVGPFTYFGYEYTRAELLRLKYGFLLVHLFQPIVSLVIPSVAFAERLRRSTPRLDARTFCFRSFLELLLGWPILAFLTTLIL